MRIRQINGEQLSKPAMFNKEMLEMLLEIEASATWLHERLSSAFTKKIAPFTPSCGTSTTQTTYDWS